jgi:hypothetical protein
MTCKWGNPRTTLGGYWEFFSNRLRLEHYLPLTSALGVNYQNTNAISGVKCTCAGNILMSMNQAIGGKELSGGSALISPPRGPNGCKALVCDLKVE